MIWRLKMMCRLEILQKIDLNESLRADKRNAYLPFVFKSYCFKSYCFLLKKNRGPAQGRYSQGNGAKESAYRKLLIFYLDFENLTMAVYKRMVPLR